MRETERERDREKEIVPEREIDTVRSGIKEIPTESEMTKTDRHK